MINILDTIRNAYDISTTQIDKIVVDGQEHRISNVEYYDDCYDEGNVFGTAIARGLEFEIENSIDLEKKEIEYFTGIKVNGETQWISLGNFIVQDIEANDTKNIAKITAMDYMIKSNITYESNLNYASGTIKVLDVLKEACSNSGLTLVTTNFPNKDFIVDSNQFAEGTLNRQVIQAVAQISGTIAKIKKDNKLYLINPKNITTVSKIFTLNNYKEAEIKRLTHPINVVSLGMADVEGENITLRDEASVTTNGENTLAINDNPFAYTQSKREQLITALFNAVKGFEYKAYSFKCQGLPYIETLDKVQFKDKEGNTYDSYIFRFNYKSPKGLESTIEAPSITKATVNYENIPNALDIAKRTEIIVNKQEQTITSLVEETTETSKKINNIIDTTSEAEGKNIYIKDSAEEPLVDISLYGETRQETRSGKNEIILKDIPSTDFRGATMSVKNGVITLNGTTTTQGVAAFSSFQVKQTGSYCFSRELSQTATSIWILLDESTDNSTWSKIVDWNFSQLTQSVVLSLSKDKYYRIRISTDTNVVLSNVIIKLQLEYNTIKTEWEQGGTMPSPEFPSEIENVEGKNKLNIDNLSNTAPSSNISIKDGVISQTSADTKTNLEWHLQTYNDSGYVGTIATKIQNTTGIISHKFTKSSSITALRFGLNGSQRNTMVYIPINHLKDGKTYTISAKIINATQGSVGWTDMQIEEGTVATPYAPYNSLEVKVEGKNIAYDGWAEDFLARVNNTSQAITETKDNRRCLKYVCSVGYKDYDNKYLFKINWKEKTSYTIQFDINVTVENIKNFVIEYTDGTTYNAQINVPVNVWTKCRIISEPNKTIKYLRAAYQNGYTTIDLDTFMVCEGNTSTDYEPYKSQTAYFPLAEGQKLMEGSYLADDGVHNKHKQGLINIEATVTLSNGNVAGVFYPPNKISKYHNMLKCSKAIFTPAGHSLIYQEGTVYENLENVCFVGNSSDTLATLQDKYNGAILEYELKEEEIIPYTEEQQKAWNKIKTLTTYKNITNITLDAYAKIVYARDNGLDIYETKQDAENKYIETTEKFAEQKITIDGIKSEVSSTQTTVGNYYKELTGKFDDYAPKSDIVSIQKSVTTLQTDTYTKTEINTKLIDGSVEKVLTTAGTFDENGLTIEKTNAKTKGNFNEKGIAVMDATSGSSQELLFAGYDEELNETIVRSKNMTVEKYFVESNIARREEYSNPVLGGKGIGVFML